MVVTKRHELTKLKLIKQKQRNDRCFGMLAFGEKTNQQKTLKETRRKKKIVIDMY